MAAMPGPGPIAPVHRITIWTAFLGAVVYLAFELKQLFDASDTASWLRVGAALLATVAIGLYLRNLGGRLNERLTTRPPS